MNWTFPLTLDSHSRLFSSLGVSMRLNLSSTWGLVLTYAWVQKDTSPTSENMNAALVWALVSTALTQLLQRFMMKYFILTRLCICPISEEGNEMLQPSWNEVCLVWDLSALALRQLVIYWAATPGMQRWKMDQSFARQRFKGISQPKSTPSSSVAQLSSQPAQLLGSLLSHGSTPAQLSKQLCGVCQRFDTPTVHSPTLKLPKSGLNYSMTHSFFKTIKHFICRKAPLTCQSDNNNTPLVK